MFSYIIGAVVCLWVFVGYAMLPYEGGWLIMITDKLNVQKGRQWMVWPALILCILLWPINRWVARIAFLIAARVL